MKRKLLLLTVALAFMGAQAFGQYQGLSQAINLVGNAVAAGAQAGMPVAGYQAGLYQLTWVASGTVSTCTVKFQDSPDNVTYTDRGSSQTCTSTGTYSFQATPTSWVRINVTAQTGSGNVTYTVVAVPNTPVAISAPSGSVLTLPTIAGGLTASGSVANDFSGSSGAFKPSTGTFTFQAAPVAATAGVNNFDLSASSGTFKTPTGAATFGGSSNVFTTAITATGTAPSDGYYFVPPSACGLTLTTGTWAANVLGGTSQAAGPFVLKAQTGNPVLQGTTTAAANTFEMECDITPPTRLLAGKGVTVNDVVYMFGYQTTALTSIGTAAVNTVTYPAAGGAAAGVVAAAGGALTVTAGTNHGTPGAITTSGNCFAEKLAFGTPFAAIVDQQSLTLTNTFVQSAAASTILQVCGVIVHYSNINSL